MDLDPAVDRAALLEQAKQYCERSLEVSDEDPYPFYLLAQIATKLGDAKAASGYIRTGRAKPGTVKQGEWLKLKKLFEAVNRE